MSKWALLKSAILGRSDIEVDNRVASIHRFKGFEVVERRKIVWNGFQLVLDIDSEGTSFGAPDNDMAGDREITDYEESDSYCCSTNTFGCFVKDARRFMSLIDCQECLLVVNFNGQLNSLIPLENMINEGVERGDIRIQYLPENGGNIFSLISDGSACADKTMSAARTAFYLKNSSAECSSKACQYFSYDLKVPTRCADPLISFADGDVPVLPTSCAQECTIEEQTGAIDASGFMCCTRDQAFLSLKNHCRLVSHQTTHTNSPDSSLSPPPSSSSSFASIHSEQHSDLSLSSASAAAAECAGIADSNPDSDSIQLCVLTKEQGQSGRVHGSGLFSHHLHGVDNTGNIRVWSSESILLFSLLNGWLRDAVEGGSVLELGGGLTGLCGLGLAFSGIASSVVITDGHPDCVRNQLFCINMNKQQQRLKREEKKERERRKDKEKEKEREEDNETKKGKEGEKDKERNKDSGPSSSNSKHLHRDHNCDVEAAKLLWSVSDTIGDLTALLNSRRGEKFDTVVAADCLFFEAFHDDLIYVLEHSLKSGGICFMLQPRRGLSMYQFMRKVETSRGLRVIFVTDDYNNQISAMRQIYLSDPMLKLNNTYDEDIHYPVLLCLQLK